MENHLFKKVFVSIFIIIVNTLIEPHVCKKNTQLLHPLEKSFQENLPNKIQSLIKWRHIV